MLFPTGNSSPGGIGVGNLPAIRVPNAAQPRGMAGLAPARGRLC